MQRHVTASRPAHLIAALSVTLTGCAAAADEAGAADDTGTRDASDSGRADTRGEADTATDTGAATGATELVVADTGLNIVGAGVSICAPVGG